MCVCVCVCVCACACAYACACACVYTCIDCCAYMSSSSVATLGVVRPFVTSVRHFMAYLFILQI